MQNIELPLGLSDTIRQIYGDNIPVANQKESVFLGYMILLKNSKGEYEMYQQSIMISLENVVTKILFVEKELEYVVNIKNYPLSDSPMYNGKEIEYKLIPVYA